MFSELIRHFGPPLDLVGPPWGHLGDILEAIWTPQGHFGGILGAHGLLWGCVFVCVGYMEHYGTLSSSLWVSLEFQRSLWTAFRHLLEDLGRAFGTPGSPLWCPDSHFSRPDCQF